MVEVISTGELRELIDVATGTSSEDDAGHVDYILIDVRGDDEMRYGVIPSSVHLCLDDFQFAWDLDGAEFKEKYGFDKPSKDDLIILYCRTGSSSAMAANFLEGKGYNVKNYKGSVQEWSVIDDNVEMY